MSTNERTETGKPLSETEFLKTIDIRDVLLRINEQDPENAFLLTAGFKKLQAEITQQAEIIRSFTDHIQTRLEQHQENLRLWKSGYLNPTEPDEDERARIKRGLEGAVYELEELLKQFPLSAESGGEQTGKREGG